MIRSLLPLLLLIGCDAALDVEDTPSAFEMPPPAPGSGTMTLTGTSTLVSGELATFVITGAGLQPGDVVEFGSGTSEGPGMCPHRPQTGGSPCLDVTGRTRKLGVAVAFDDGGVVKAVLQVALTRIDPMIYVQGFFLNGTSSATSNVHGVMVLQSWPELDPRVDALEAAVADMQGTIDAQADTINDLTQQLADLGGLEGDLSLLESQVSQLQIDVAPLVMLPSTVSMLQSDVSTLQMLQPDVMTLQSQVSMLQSTTMTTQMDLDLAESNLMMLQSEVSFLTPLPSQLMTTQMDVMNLQMQQSTLSFELDMTESNLDFAEMEIDMLQSETSSLGTTTMNLQSDVWNLQSTMGGVLADLAGLSTVPSDLMFQSSQISALQGDVSVLSGDLGAVASDLDSAQLDIADLQADFAGLEDGLTVDGPVRIGTSIYNAWSGKIPLVDSYSSDALHLKTAWTCVGGVMWNVEFEGYNFQMDRPIKSTTVGYSYSAVGGITHDTDINYDSSTTVTTYCSSDGFVSFKLESAYPAPNRWHASNVVLNLHAGPISYHIAAADTFAITAQQMRSSNF